jgi:hypothetical protein
MPIVDDLRAFLLKTGGQTKLADQVIALCHILDEKLTQKIDKLPPRHVDGESKLTARSKRPMRRVE